MKRKKRRRGMLAKEIELEKAYDRLQQTFIHDTPQAIQLPGNRLPLIMECMRSSSMGILFFFCEKTVFFSNERNENEEREERRLKGTSCIRYTRQIEERSTCSEFKLISYIKKRYLLPFSFFIQKVDRESLCPIEPSLGEGSSSPVWTEKVSRSRSPYGLSPSLT